MVVSIHPLDDGAWISVNNARRISVSQLWELARHEFCDCERADLLAEAFVAVGVDPPDIDARVAGQCITCGESGVTDWLTVGRMVERPESADENEPRREFRPIVPESVHVPRRRTRLARPE